MMAINFPDSPSVNDTHTVSDKTYVWDGTAWSVVVGGIPSAISDLSITNDLTVDAGTLHVDSTNERVGIGTSSPAEKLEVVDSVATVRLSSSVTVPTANTELQAIDFYQSDASGGAGVSARIVGSANNLSGAQNIEFHTGQAGASSVTERMRIDSSGRVGIGTTSPDAQLTVKASSTGLDDGTVEFHSWSGSASSPTEVEDWPTPVLALRAYDNFNRQSFLSFGYPNDAIYQTGNAVWNVRLETSGGNATSSSSSTHFELYGPGTFKTGNFTTNGGKSFTIAHPLPELRDTHDLRHSVVEAPQADNLYRGHATLVDGVATVNLDDAAEMTEGTFVLLNRDIQCFTSNEDGWTAVRGSVAGNVLTIVAQDSSCVDNVSWMVVGERQDDDIKESTLTDDEGHLVVEPLTNRMSEADIAESEARMETARIEALEAG